jgi:hypothetical protein
VQERSESTRSGPQRSEDARSGGAARSAALDQLEAYSAVHEAAAGGRVPADLHFHDLRHTGNHFAAASGATTRELMGRIGPHEYAGRADLPASERGARSDDRGRTRRDAPGGGVSGILGTLWAGRVGNADFRLGEPE